MKNIVLIGASASIGNAILDKFKNENVFASYYEGSICEDYSYRMKLNLEEDKSINDFIKSVKDVMLEVDLIICLASILPGESLKDYSSKNITKVMDINFIGQVKIIKGFLSILSSESQIIMVSSISAQRGSYDPVYAASKGAINSFTKALAVNGIRANSIAPGLIKDSTMYNQMTEDRISVHKAQIKNKTFLDIADLANIIYDISQDHWKHLNGACIDLNGGAYVR